MPQGSTKRPKMSRQLVSVSKDSSEKIVQEQDDGENAVKVVDSEESVASSKLVAALRTVPMSTKEVQTDDSLLQQKELKYLSCQISRMYLRTTKKNLRYSRIDGKCSHKFNALSCDPPYQVTQKEEDGQRTRLCAGYSKSKLPITKGHIFLDRSVDLGSIPATMFPPLPHSKINLVTMKANATDADMFRGIPESLGDTVLQEECSIEMKRPLPDLV